MNQLQTFITKAKKSFRAKPLSWLLLIALLLLSAWIMFQTIKNDRLGFSTLTLWDWMELVIVPATIGFGVFFFSRAQSKSERLIAANHEEELMLQEFMSSMGNLILEKRLRYLDLSTETGKDLQIFARGITIMTLRGLVTPNPDGNNRRRGSLLRFLHESELVNGSNPIISLNKANLENAYLRKMDLRNVNLKGVSLYKAYLRGANLENANLSEAYMVKVDLRGANLHGANLENINLNDAIYGKYNGVETVWPENFDLTKHRLIRYRH